jgi:hypothetical protein
VGRQLVLGQIALRLAENRMQRAFINLAVQRDRQSLATSTSDLTAQLDVTSTLRKLGESKSGEDAQ